MGLLSVGEAVAYVLKKPKASVGPGNHEVRGFKTTRLLKRCLRPKPVYVRRRRDSVKKHERRVPRRRDHPIRSILIGQWIGECNQRVGSIRQVDGIDRGPKTIAVQVKISPVDPPLL